MLIAQIAMQMVEGTRCVVQPAIDDPGGMVAYFRGSWCPADADNIVFSGDRRF